MGNELKTLMLMALLETRCRASGYKNVSIEVEAVHDWCLEAANYLPREMWTVTVRPPRRTYPDHAARKKKAPRIPLYDVFKGLPFDTPVLWDQKHYQAARVYRDGT